MGANVNELETRVKKLEGQVQSIEQAFPLNEFGLPNYAGHNQEHKDSAEESKNTKEYKKAVTLKLLQGAAGLLITLIGFGIGPYISSKLGN